MRFRTTVALALLVVVLAVAFTTLASAEDSQASPPRRANHTRSLKNRHNRTKHIKRRHRRNRHRRRRVRRHNNRTRVMGVIQRLKRQHAQQLRRVREQHRREKERNQRRKERRTKRLAERRRRRITDEAKRTTREAKNMMEKLRNRLNSKQTVTTGFNGVKPYVAPHHIVNSNILNHRGPIGAHGEGGSDGLHRKRRRSRRRAVYARPTSPLIKHKIVGLDRFTRQVKDLKAELKSIPKPKDNKDELDQVNKRLGQLDAREDALRGVLKEVRRQRKRERKVRRSHERKLAKLKKAHKKALLEQQKSIKAVVRALVPPQSPVNPDVVAKDVEDMIRGRPNFKPFPRRAP